MFIYPQVTMSTASIIEQANAWFHSAGMTTTVVANAIPHPTRADAFFVNVPGQDALVARHVRDEAANVGIDLEVSGVNNLLIKSDGMFALRYVS